MKDLILKDGRKVCVEKRNNIFIEGTQGSGKSTLTTKLAQKLPDYHPYREGDLSPVELAWCSYLTLEQYREVLKRYPDYAGEIKKNTLEEGSRKIVSYTLILTEQREFYEYMESFEIYNGRVPLEEFKKIVRTRYQNLDTYGNIFECSLFQNSIENLMLFYELSDGEIIKFYREMYQILKGKNMKLFYLQSDDLRASIEQIKKERVDDEGNEVWFELVRRYFETSPFGVRNHCSGIEDYLKHLERRVGIERKVIEEIMNECTLVLPAKKYELDEVLSHL